MNKKNNSTDNNFQYLKPERIEEIKETFKLLGIDFKTKYPGAKQTSNNFKKASLLVSEGYNYSTSNSTLLK